MLGGSLQDNWNAIEALLWLVVLPQEAVQFKGAMMRLMVPFVGHMVVPVGKSHWAIGVLRDRRDPDPLRLGLRGSPGQISRVNMWKKILTVEGSLHRLIVDAVELGSSLVDHGSAGNCCISQRLPQ
jgi:hypothetical protein